MRATLAVLALALVAATGCGSKRTAALDCSSSQSKAPECRLKLVWPTGQYSFSPHGGVYGKVRPFEIVLPAKPANLTAYDFSEVSLDGTTSDPDGILVRLTGGSVEIDQKSGTVRVSLETSRGDFWANGVYSLKGI
jgi:hypothetical protein